MRLSTADALCDLKSRALQERKWGHSPIPSKWGQTSFGCEGCRLALRGLTPFAREAGNWGMSPFPFWRSLALGCAALSCQRFVSGHTDRARLNEPPRSTCRASPRAAPLEFARDGMPARTGAPAPQPRPPFARDSRQSLDSEWRGRVCMRTGARFTQSLGEHRERRSRKRHANPYYRDVASFCRCGICVASGKRTPGILASRIPEARER